MSEINHFKTVSLRRWCMYTGQNALCKQIFSVSLLGPLGQFASCLAPPTSSPPQHTVHLQSAKAGSAIANMTYDWEPYKGICYRVYVEEKKSLRKLQALLK